MAGPPTLAVHISLTLKPKSVYSNLAEELLRIVDDVEQTLDIVSSEPLTKECFHQRSQTPRGIVQNMLQLFVIAVYITDNMHCPLGEMQQGLQMGDLVYGSVNRGEASRQNTQRRQFLRGNMGRL